tara:strand:+ start:995 stop:1285 length:291 start_codon:yes stop_codon:yes gene_type:complete
MTDSSAASILALPRLRFARTLRVDRSGLDRTAILQRFRPVYGDRSVKGQRATRAIRTNGDAPAWMMEKIYSWHHATMNAIGQTQPPPGGGRLPLFR